MPNLNVLIIEDDAEVCGRFAEYADTLEDISIVSVTNNSSKALMDIEYFLPDTIILDLELHKGGGSGLEFLSGLKNLSLPISPYILVTTNNSSTVTYECARQLGADFIMSKHQENYSERYVIDFLRMMSSSIKRKAHSSSLSSTTTESPYSRHKRILNIITLELNRVGINPKSVGYAYLADAIEIMIDSSVPNVCSYVAQKHNKSEPSVQRAMQNAIDKAWKTSSIDELLTYYTVKIQSIRGNPTISEFVCFYATKIRNEL